MSVKVVILAGGLGTRISEETAEKPKPMVKIGEEPMVWHIMNIFASQGFTKFVIATGYKHKVIEDYIQTLENDWDIECLFTGQESQTGWRIRACLEHINADSEAIVTYGDGLANVSVEKLLAFHRQHGKVATVTAVRPPARFGVLEFENGQVTHFGEKNQADSGWINGGFFVLNTSLSEIPKSPSTSFESDILPDLASRGQLMAYQHHGFWQPMDTLREKNILVELANNPMPPWLYQPA